MRRDLVLLGPRTPRIPEYLTWIIARGRTSGPTDRSGGGGGGRRKGPKFRVRALAPAHIKRCGPTEIKNVPRTPRF